MKRIHQNEIRHSNLVIHSDLDNLVRSLVQAENDSGIMLRYQGKTMIIDCLSDLHGHYPELEGGDLLIVAGDLTRRDTIEEMDRFSEWLQKQNYEKKILIGGNHDNLLMKETSKKYNLTINDKIYEKFEYLCDSGTKLEYIIDGFPEEDEGFLPSGKRILKIWGSPWTKSFEGMNPNCKAFTVDTDEELAQKWDLIPSDTDILITHSPPYGIMDSLYDPNSCGNYHVGSLSLMQKIKEIKPKLHVFGHIHENHGVDADQWINGKLLALHEDWPVTKYVNASYVNEYYEPVNKSIRIIL